MNAINTSSSGPPTSVVPTQPITQPATKSAIRPTTPFMALLAALGATDAGSANVAGSAATTAADVGGAASTTAADVASSGDSGSVATLSYPQTPNVAPAGGHRRHDESATTPVFAFGVPVTIAAIPIASLTTGNVARPQSLAVSGTPTALLATQGNSAQDGASAATLAVSSNVADKPASSALSASTASLAAMSLAATSEAGNASASVVATTTGQSSSVPFTQAVKANTTLTSASGVALTSLTTATAPNSAPTGDNNVGVMATAANGVDATNVVASAAVPLKSARHSSSESMPTETWAANIGPVGGANTGTTTASPPTHPAVTGAAQQIATQATLLHNGQSAEMQLRLRPPDLGDVRVILRRDATGALSAHLIPATREAGDVLNANLHHLRTALDQHSQGQRAAVSVGQHTVADQRQHMNGGHSSHEDETSASDPATPPAKSNQPIPQRISRAVAATGVIDYDA